MAKKESNGHKTETPDVSHIRNVEVTHETSDVNVRGVLTFCVVLAVATIVIGIGIWLLFKFFNQQRAKEPGPGPMALSRDREARLPPEPRLQAAPGFQITLENGEIVNLERAAPQTEYRVLRQQWEENLKTGLKDQSGNVVGMPIDEAIRKVASQGLPAKPKDPNKKFQDYAIQMPTAPSSGRELEKRLQ